MIISKNLTPSIINNFILGRDDELKEISNYLKHNNLLLLNGAGGVGKSSLARGYAKQNEDEYNHIAFIEQNGDIKSSFVNALSLSFNLKNNNSFDTILAELKKLKGKNLLIIDNLSEDFEYISELQNNFKILITSQYRINIANSYKIHKLSPKNSINLFKKYCNIDDNEKIIKILEFLDYHTLFIKLIAKTPNIETMLSKFENGSIARVRAELEEESFNPFLDTIIDISKVSNEELLLLQKLSLFPSVYISITDLIDYLSIQDMKIFSLILDSIHQKGWITKNNNSYKLHKIIKDFFIANHKIQYVQYEDIIIYFSKKLSLHSTSNPIELFKYLPYVSSILSEVNDKKENIATVYNNISMIYKAMGELEKALEYQKKALSLTQEVLGEKHPSLATSYNNISLIYQDMGELEKALEYQKKALSLTQEVLGEKHPSLATSYNNISTIYQAMGELEKALEYQKKALSLRQEVLGEKHPDLATSYNNISTIYKARGELEKALEYQKKALSLTQEVLGEKHPSLAKSYNNISMIYKAMGELEKALEYQKKALSLRQEVLGEKHPDLAKSYNNISLIYKAMGELEKALEYQKKALSLRQEVLGEKHPDLATSYNNISMIYKDMGELEKALEYQKKALSLRQEVLGEKHPDLATSYNNISLIYQARGELEKALEYQKKALSLRQEVLGEKHPDLATSYNNISTIYQDMGELEKALEYQKKALSLRQEVLGEKHPDLATSYNNISTIYKARGELEKALEYQKKALSLRQEVLGEKHPDLVTSYNNISLIYKDMGELEKALEYQKKALSLRQEVLGEKHPSLATSYNNISMIYKAMGELEKALEYQKKAIKINPQDDEVHYNIGLCYEKKREYNKAIRSYEKAIEINPKQLYKENLSYVENQEKINKDISQKMGSLDGSSIFKRIEKNEKELKSVSLWINVVGIFLPVTVIAIIGFVFFIIINYLKVDILAIPWYLIIEINFTVFFISSPIIYIYSTLHKRKKILELSIHDLEDKHYLISMFISFTKEEKEKYTDKMLDIMSLQSTAKLLGKLYSSKVENAYPLEIMQNIIKAKEDKK